MRLSQPQPILDVVDPRENVPAIGGLPDFAGHLGHAEHIAAGCGSTPNNRNDCRQRRNPTVVTLFHLRNALGVGHVDLVQPDDDARASD
jgi:hypothetical protein